MRRCLARLASEGTRCTAAVARGVTEPLKIETLTLQNPREDEVVCRVVSTGICHTDVHTLNHGLCAFPAVLGHEGTGVVEKVGRSVRSVAVGDHVVMTYARCGSCQYCSQASPAYCVHHGMLNFAGARLDGSGTLSAADTGETVTGSFFQQSSFATHSLVQERNLVKVDQGAPLGMLAPLACASQTGAGAIINSFALRPGSSAAVFGCGAVGLSSVMAAGLVSSASCVLAVDVTPERLALAKELGATHTHLVDLTHTPEEARAAAVEAMMEATGGAGMNYALDTSGNKGVMRTAVEGLAPMGVCGMVAPGAPGQSVELSTLSLLAGKQFRGIVQGDSNSAVFLPELLGHWKQGRFPFERLVTLYDSLSDVNTAISDMQSGKTIKPVLKIDHTPEFWL